MNNELTKAQTLIEQTGMNVLLLGKAGTGKTTFLRNLYQRGMKRMVILAPTGVAAMNAGGTTIHSFFQLPLSPFVPDTQFRTNDSSAQRRFKFSKEKRAIIRSLDLLVIDEISMVRADLLDAVDQVLRRFRTDHHKPFGGVQLLLIGDLAQLAPVVTDRDRDILRGYYDTPFFYGSKALQITPYVSIELTKVFRQTDEQFLNILNEIRSGNVKQETLDLLNKRYQPEAANTEGYIRLTTHNRTADNYNQQMLDAIDRQEFTYKCKVEGDFPANLYPIDEELRLKEGAQVMFCKNDSSAEHQYYNGKIAQVIDLEKNKIVVQCLEDDEIVEVPQHEWTNSKYTLDSETHEIVEDIQGRFVQFPLRLAWAITIHKSQGLTFDNCIIDAEHSFASGQVYVALSRCRTLEGLVLSSPISTRGIIVEQSVRAYLDDQTERSTDATKDMAMLRKAYYVNLISEMYDFNGIYQAHERVQRILQDGYVKKMPALVSRYNEAYMKVKPELINVADKFKAQYDYLIANSEDYENDEKIKERLEKGTEYFTNKLKEIYKNILGDEAPSTENKAIQERMDTAHADFMDILRIKTETLKEIKKSGFSTTNYLKAKAKAATSDVKKKRTTRKRK
ncbi:MAG: AAA family ATPase [Bacteroidaceae bacterium]|nr:AAA family ATPase [Bacteroidaceae bacterium]